MKRYDLAIIGSGPGGYVAALYASRLGLHVCIIEKGSIGGTCLNRGCVPTKSLIHSALLFSQCKSAPTFGVHIDGISVDFPRVIARKDEIVSRMRGGVEFLLKNLKVDVIKGEARLISGDSISVDGVPALQARSIIIATGSRVLDLPSIACDETDILSSDAILNLKEIPKSLVIVGGGVIGCEFASLFNMLGTKVTIVELADRLIPTQSREVSKKLELIYKKRGIAVILSSKVESVLKSALVTTKIAGKDDIISEKVLIAIGRQAEIDGIGLADVGIRLDGGRIAVNENLRTSIPNIYAIGDCVSGPQLAHKASYDAMVACDAILGGSRKVDYSKIPNCIWSYPQVASIGLTEEEARAKHKDIKVAKFPYTASSKATIDGETEGFVKMVAGDDARILGVEMIGEAACELIGEAAMAITMGMTIDRWASVVHPHPTVSEVFQEAAYQFLGRGIHSL